MALLEVCRIKDGRAILGVVGKVRYSFQVHLLECVAATESDAGSRRASTSGQLAVSMGGGGNGLSIH